MQLSARAGLLVVGLAVVMTAGGCGADASSADASGGSTATTAVSAPSATTTAPATATKACALLSLDQVSDLFGTAASVDEDKMKECVWLGRKGAMHQLHLQIYIGESYYSPARWGGTAGAVEGLGDEAFSVAKSPLGATVGFKRGESVVFLNYQILLSGDAKPGDAINTLTALARAVEGRV